MISGLVVTGTNLKFHLSNLVPFGSLRRGPAGLGKSAFCQQRGQFYGVVRVSFARVCSGHRTNQDWSTKSDTNSVNIPIKESVLALQTLLGWDCLKPVTISFPPIVYYLRVLCGKSMSDHQEGWYVDGIPRFYAVQAPKCAYLAYRALTGEKP